MTSFVCSCPSAIRVRSRPVLPLPHLLSHALSTPLHPETHSTQASGLHPGLSGTPEIADVRRRRRLNHLRLICDGSDLNLLCFGPYYLLNFFHHLHCRNLCFFRLIMSLSIKKKETQRVVVVTKALKEEIKIQKFEFNDNKVCNFRFVCATVNMNGVEIVDLIASFYIQRRETRVTITDGADDRKQKFSLRAHAHLSQILCWLHFSKQSKLLDWLIDIGELWDIQTVFESEMLCI